MPPDFFNQPTIDLAKALLGQKLVNETADGRAAGIIVETEAYLSAGDLASHSAHGQTKRNAVMFGPPGHTYVYFTYGMHWLFNVTAGPDGVGEAVLIRALAPTDGIDLMASRRKLDDIRLLTNGPGKLVQAMAILPEHNGLALTGQTLRIEPGQPPAQIITTTRIGIRQSAQAPLRFYVKDNPFVSRPR